MGPKGTKGGKAGQEYAEVVLDVSIENVVQLRICTGTPVWNVAIYVTWLF